MPLKKQAEVAGEAGQVVGRAVAQERAQPPGAQLVPGGEVRLPLGPDERKERGRGRVVGLVDLAGVLAAVVPVGVEVGRPQAAQPVAGFDQPHPVSGPREQQGRGHPAGTAADDDDSRRRAHAGRVPHAGGRRCPPLRRGHARAGPGRGGARGPLGPLGRGFSHVRSRLHPPRSRWRRAGLLGTHGLCEQRIARLGSRRRLRLRRPLDARHASHLAAARSPRSGARWGWGTGLRAGSEGRADGRTR